MKKKYLLLLVAAMCSISSYAQKKNYKVACIGFYNLENLFDTINQPEVNDEEFTPAGANHYTPEVYKDKLIKLETVIADMGKEMNDDGVTLLGVAEIENITVLQDLIQQPSLKNRKWQIVHYDSPDERGIDVGC